MSSRQAFLFLPKLIQIDRRHFIKLVKFSCDMRTCACIPRFGGGGGGGGVCIHLRKSPQPRNQGGNSQHWPAYIEPSASAAITMPLDQGLIESTSNHGARGQLPSQQQRASQPGSASRYIYIHECFTYECFTGLASWAIMWTVLRSGGKPKSILYTSAYSFSSAVFCGKLPVGEH